MKFGWEFGTVVIAVATFFGMDELGTRVLVGVAGPAYARGNIGDSTILQSRRTVDLFASDTWAIYIA